MSGGMAAAVDAPTPYDVHLKTRCDAWRAKFPDRAAAVRILVARFLGAPLAAKLDRAWVHEYLEGPENDVLRAVLGWPDEAHWTPETGG